MAAKDKKRRRAKGTGSVFWDARRKVWVGRRKVAGRVVQRSHARQDEMLRLLDRATPPASGCTVGEWLGRWLDDTPGRVQTSVSRAGSVSRYLIPSLGSLRLPDLTHHHVERASASWSAAGLAPGTVRLVLSQLHTALRAAVRAGLRPDNPAALAARPRSPRASVEPIPAADLSRVVAAATAAGGASRAVALLAATGLRVGEALGLDVADFDPAAGTVRVRRTALVTGGTGPPKSDHGSRTVRVPAAALPAVLAARGNRESGPLFVGYRGGRNTHTGVTTAWETLARRLGLPRANLHRLRHSCVSHALARGHNVVDVARWAGDVPNTILRTYAHAIPGADVSDAMDAVLAAGRRAGGSAQRGRGGRPKERA